MAGDEPEPKKPTLVGTPVYDNLRAFLNGAPRLGGYEYVLHSDARLTGEVATAVAPYSFINLVPFGEERGRVRTAVAVRAWIHVDFDIPAMNKTDHSRYHGGDAADEIAALASLLCGVRFRAGNQTRTFDVGGDTMGRPVAWGTRPDPVLAIGLRGFVLPAVAREHSLMPLEELSHFPQLRPSEAITVTRVARLYQDALWLAESEPNLSWLLLVAAVETAANCWSTGESSLIARMSEARPELMKYLESTAGADVAARVATEFADSVGSTKKFVEFLVAHVPDPPEVRPGEWGQADWSGEGLRRAFRQIYGYRSRALHDGMPFPAPMCDPPHRHETWSCGAEKPIGLAASVGGGTWLAKDMPMLLHTFEYIARNALMGWWAGLVRAS
jgi:hypothetical protein